MGQARPGSGIGLLDSPTGSSLPSTPEAATKQITAKATGTMLANGHKGTKQASVLACRSRSERNYARTNKKTKFLAQVTEPKVFVNAS
jgi:hypothetical protein